MRETVTSQSRTKFLALVASLSAANAAMRIAMAGAPPNIKPTGFFTIVTGIVGGAMAGFSTS